jgi:hypothetical protein
MKQEGLADCLAPRRTHADPDESVITSVLYLPLRDEVPAITVIPETRAWENKF